MRFFVRSFAPLTLILLAAGGIAACGDSSRSDNGGQTSTDGGTTSTDAGAANNADAGGTTSTDGGTTSTDGGMPIADCGPTGAAHHHSYVPCTEHPKSPSRVIVMGDSISAGYGTTDPSNPQNSPYTTLAYYNLLLQNDDTTWPSEMNTTLSAKFADQNIELVNVAVPGATSTDMANKQPGALSQKLGASVSGHSIVLITIGGNDLMGQLQSDVLQGPNDQRTQQTIDTAVANVRQVITYLQDSTRFPDGTSVYLAAVYDPSDGSGKLPASCGQADFGVAIPVSDPGLEKGVNELHDAYVQLGSEMGFAIVDALGHYHGHGVDAANMSDMYYDASDPQTWFYGDCIHPTNAGHNELRRLFFEAIDGKYQATDL